MSSSTSDAVIIDGTSIDAVAHEPAQTNSGASSKTTSRPSSSNRKKGTTHSNLIDKPLSVSSVSDGVKKKGKSALAKNSNAENMVTATLVSTTPAATTTAPVIPPLVIPTSTASTSTITQSMNPNPNLTSTTNASVSYHTTNININTSPSVQVPVDTLSGFQNASHSPSNSSFNSTLQALLPPIHLPPSSPGNNPNDSALALSAESTNSPSISSPSSDNPVQLLQGFQSHAMNTVQNLAASFGHIATVLQKEQNHAAREEENTRRKLASLQSMVAQLTQANRDLAIKVDRNQERNTVHQREWNEKINNIHNRVVVLASATGVTQLGQQSRRGSVGPNSGISDHALFSSSTGGSPIGLQGGISDASTQLLLERITHIEIELSSAQRRADQSEQRMEAFAHKLGEATKKNHELTLRLIENSISKATGQPISLASKAVTPRVRSAHKGGPKPVSVQVSDDDDDDGDSLAGSELSDLLPQLEIVDSLKFDRTFSESDATRFESFGGSEQGQLNTTAIAASNVATNVALQQLSVQVEELTTRQRALTEMVIPSDKQAAFQARLQAMRDDIEQFGNDNAAQHPSTSAPVSMTPTAAAATSAESTAGVPPRAPPSGPRGSISPSGHYIPGGTDQPIVSQHYNPRLMPDSSFTYNNQFTPRGNMKQILAEQQMNMQSAIENAAAAAVAAQQKKKDTLLSAETMAATAAAHQAQLAVKQAQDILKSIHFMKDNLQYSQPVPQDHQIPKSAEEEAELNNEKQSLTINASLAAKKKEDDRKKQERALWVLESTVSSLSNQLQDVQKTAKELKDVNSNGMKNLNSDFSNILSQFQALSRQFQAQHKVLDGRISNYREEFDSAIKHSLESLTTLERNLEKKADMKLVLDKVSRSEYNSQIKKLKQIDDEILNRSVNKEEYRLQLNEIREVMSEDQRERIQNITRIANELTKLVSDLEQKASKSELLDMANVLNSMPKVHDEVENLKSYVNREIESRATEILDVTIDRKQLKRSMTRLLKSLQDEVQSATLPVNCDACALRTGVHSGTNCLSCAQQMKLNARLASYSSTSGYAHVEPHPEHEILASRGGGFMVTNQSSPAASPSPPGSAYGRRPGSKGATMSLVQHEWRGGGGNMRPGSTAGRASSSSSSVSYSRTVVLPQAAGASGAVDHFPIPTGQPLAVGLGSLPPPAPQSLSARSELGSDGRLYTSRGSRTHRLVANGQKNRARAEEDDDESTLAQWKHEEKDDFNSSKGGSLSARPVKK